MSTLEFTAKKCEGRSLNLPAALLSISELDGQEDLEMIPGEGVLVIMKRQMTAMELINAAENLRHLSSNLYADLATECGMCDDCEHCPYEEPITDDAELSEEVREKAGISEHRKLCVEVDKKNHRAIVSDAGYEHDIRDAPQYLQEMFICAGISLCDLDQHLRQGDFVYGGE